MVTYHRSLISHIFDPLYRLTAADYDDGGYFHYAYDAVGNRELQVTEAYTNTYTYDEANRLTAVDSITYTWDANGNLLDDGAKSYEYDLLNRLVSVDDGQVEVTFDYNGLNDRVQQSEGANMTTYTLDIAAGLTQVLSDGTDAYLYGAERIAQEGTSGKEYFLGDALGSVRQLVDAEGLVTLTKAYEPYGEVLNSAGDGVTSYRFGSEWTDSTGLIYLRARYYAPYLNQFIQPDPIVPDYSNPQNLNAYSYVRNNPVRFTDPSGLSPDQFTSNDRDLTWWLYKELTANVKSYYVRRIKTLLSGSLSDKGNAIAGWIYLVKDKAKWDFKHKINLEMGRAITFFDNNQGFKW